MEPMLISVKGTVVHSIFLFKIVWNKVIVLSPLLSYSVHIDKVKHNWLPGRNCHNKFIIFMEHNLTYIG
jgi:hypothetical protein